jgi:tetratricopeptide (TPR) repeat protein
MFKYIAGLCIICSLVVAQNHDALVDSAITLDAARHLDPSNLDAARDILLKVLEREPDHLRANNELSKVYYHLGDRAETKDEKVELYTKGTEYGQKAIKIDGDDKWAHFWYVVNLGRRSQTKGVFNSLAYVPTVKKEVNRVLEIDPEHTGALDVKAMFYYTLPGLLGGNVNKSIELLHEAIALDSAYALLYVDMAKCYVKKKEYDKARQYLEKVIVLESPTYEADYVLKNKPDAEQLLEEIKDL